MHTEHARIAGDREEVRPVLITDVRICARAEERALASGAPDCTWTASPVLVEDQQTGVVPPRMPKPWPRGGLTGELRPIDSVALTAHSPPVAVSRELTRREREVSALMVDRTGPFDPDEPDRAIEDSDGTRWRAQLGTARAGAPCGCGSCPSIELTDTVGVSPERTKSRRVVLGAESDKGTLLLFIDDDQLSYLELAPTGDRASAEFPDPTDIRNG